MNQMVTHYFAIAFSLQQMARSFGFEHTSFSALDPGMLVCYECVDDGKLKLAMVLSRNDRTTYFVNFSDDCEQLFQVLRPTSGRCWTLLIP